MGIEELKLEYDSRASLHALFIEAVRTELAQIAKANRIALAAQIEGRLKTWESITEKIDRKILSLNTLGDLTDLCGLRLLLLFQPDKAVMTQAIREHFHVIDEYDTADRLAPDQFGYSSYHQIVRFPSSWLTIPSYSHFGGLQAELQTRSVAQHIWAAASHVLQYKRETSVPKEIRRSIYRVSALLETVDLELDRLLHEREAYSDQLEGANLADSPLDIDSLRIVLKELWGDRYEHSNDAISDLLDELKHFEIDSVQKLRALIERQRAAAEEEDQEYVGRHPGEIEEPEVNLGRTNNAHRTYFTDVGMTRNSLQHEFKEKYKSYKSRRSSPKQIDDEL